MILKIRDESVDADYTEGAWVYFDNIEKISVKCHRKVQDRSEIKATLGGGIYAKIDENFLIATIERSARNRRADETWEVFQIAFHEGFLLGDNGKTIERL